MVEEILFWYICLCYIVFYLFLNNKCFSIGVVFGKYFKVIGLEGLENEYCV